MAELAIYNGSDLNHIASKILKGYAAVVETDTLVGLVAKDARVLGELKKRPADKQFITFVNKPVQTGNKLAIKLMKKHWPGALTLVIGGVAYRMRDHKQLLRLISLTGPLYSTSCNLSGHLPVMQSIDAKAIFSTKADSVIIVRGKQRDRIASTVYDCDQKLTLRQGRIEILGED